MRTLFRNALWIHTGDPARPGMADGQVSVVNGRIECVQSLPLPAPADEIIDLDGCLLIPGLINTHHHFFQSLTRALPEVHRAASEDWLAALYPVWARMDAADIAAAARNAAAELLLSGVTTSVDHAFLLRAAGDERLAAQVEAVGELGLRQHLVRSGLTAIGGQVETRVATRLGPGLPGLIDDADHWLAQCAADLARWHDPAPGSMLRLALASTAAACMRTCIRVRPSANFRAGIPGSNPWPFSRRQAGSAKAAGSRIAPNLTTRRLNASPPPARASRIARAP